MASADPNGKVMLTEMPNDVSAEKLCSAEHRDGELIGVHGLPDLAALRLRSTALPDEAK
jgi:hypothetical protein